MMPEVEKGSEQGRPALPTLPRFIAAMLSIAALTGLALYLWFQSVVMAIIGFIAAAVLLQLFYFLAIVWQLFGRRLDVGQTSTGDPIDLSTAVNDLSTKKRVR